MADFAALKAKETKAPAVSRDKGAPPMRAEAPRNMQRAAREKPERKRTVQFPLSEEMLEAFSEEAHRRFGPTKGAKLSLFLDMWKVYQLHTKG